MSWFNKHSVQAFFYNKIWVIRRAGGARRSLCVLLLCTMSSFWLWFVMICHHLKGCATCDSNRDNMTAGCWPLWCACFSSKFTDPYKEKPGLHPDSTTGWKSSNCSFTNICQTAWRDFTHLWQWILSNTCFHVVYHLGNDGNITTFSTISAIWAELSAVICCLFNYCKRFLGGWKHSRLLANNLCRKVAKCLVLC